MARVLQPAETRNTRPEPMYTLGINAAYHDTSACLVHDGRVLAAAEEERFTGIKHGKRPVPFSAWELPFHAIDYCLAHAGIELADVDHVAYSYDPYLLLDPRVDSLTLPLQPSAHARPDEAPWDGLFVSHLLNAERQLVDGVPHRLAPRFRSAKQRRRWRWHFVEHHLSHEASAFLASPFDEAAVMTLDGRGELTSTSFGHYAQGDYRRLRQIDLPSSLGLLYEEVTEYLGFLRASDEYKVMALASYGQPRYIDAFREIVRGDGDGGYRVDKPVLAERFGAARLAGDTLEQKHCDVARSLQAVLEETVLDLASWLARETGARQLCMAGGVALNCALNARLRDRGPFSEVWVQPAAGDAGTALGAALWIDWRHRGERGYCMEDTRLGPAFSDAMIEAALAAGRLDARPMRDVAAETADLLADDKVVGWFQGRMEFGPRALGARSILASPASAGTQRRLNEIKDREAFRPVAPAVPEERAAEWFVNARRSPFMLFVFDVVEHKAGEIPAVRHVDGTARVQTVSRAEHPLFHDLLEAFAQRTGIPVLVNTSLNTRGRPIACTPRDAIECFFTSGLDALAIGSWLLEKGRA